MNTSEVKAKIGSVGFDMLVELGNIQHLADTIQNDLFEGREPDVDMYRADYDRLVSLFNIMSNMLYKFEDEFSLLIGEGTTPHFERGSRHSRLNDLMEIDEWWRTPESNSTGRAVTHPK